MTWLQVLLSNLSYYGIRVTYVRQDHTLRSRGGRAKPLCDNFLARSDLFFASHFLTPVAVECDDLSNFSSLYYLLLVLYD
jgi:hypothetical protein